MNVQARRHGRFDRMQERQELLMPVIGFARRDDRAVQHIQGGTPRGGAMPFIIMSDALGVTETPGQQRLRPLQGLYLALFIHAQHEGLLGRR